MKKAMLSIGIFMFGIFAATAQSDANVSDAELQKFADAYQTVQQENQKMQQKFVAAIEEEGLEAQRFNEIYEAKMDPEKETDASEDEMKKQEAAMSKIEKMQKDLQSKMESKIKEKGLTMEKYEQIGAQLQQSPELQQKLQAMMMEGQQGGGQNPQMNNQN